MIVFCECNSSGCLRRVEMPISTLEEIKKDLNHVIIVEGCARGPEPTDIFVSEGSGYTVYSFVSENPSPCGRG